MTPRRRPRVIVVYKRSALSLAGGARGRWWRRLPSEARVALRESDLEHHAALAAVLSALRGAGCSPSSLYRSDVRTPLRADLVVTVGGDGTLLEAAAWVDTTPVLSVNSSPRHSVGIFAGAETATVRDRLAAWRAGRLRSRRLPRMQVLVNGRALRWPVLNDVLLAHRNPAAMTRYELRIGRRVEAQRSSGLWVATGPGSTGGSRSAGAPILPLFTRELAFAVREPYRGLDAIPRLVRGRTAGGLSVRCVTRDTALYLDGAHRSLRLEPGDRVEFAPDGPPLEILGLDPSRRRIPWREPD